MKIVLNPLSDIELQSALIIQFRDEVKTRYRNEEIEIKDLHEHTPVSELLLNIRIVLCILRELFPEYYDPLFLDRKVQSLRQLTRNKKKLENAKIVEKTAREYDFHPRINPVSEFIEN